MFKAIKQNLRLKTSWVDKLKSSSDKYVYFCIIYYFVNL